MTLFGIDRLLAEVASDPNLFDIALETSLTFCAAERSVENVSRSVRESLRPLSDVNVAFAEVRGARSYADLDAARGALVSALLSAGCEVDRDSVAALVGKAMIPGSSPVTDRWIRRLTVGRRTVSNVPAQALILMNDPFVHQQATLWAKHVFAGK